MSNPFFDDCWNKVINFLFHILLLTLAGGFGDEHWDGVKLAVRVLIWSWRGYGVEPSRLERKQSEREKGKKESVRKREDKRIESLNESDRKRHKNKQSKITLSVTVANGLRLCFLLPFLT